jgi:hypothetical protein
MVSLGSPPFLNNDNPSIGFNTLHATKQICMLSPIRVLSGIQELSTRIDCRSSTKERVDEHPNRFVLIYCHIQDQSRSNLDVECDDWTPMAVTQNRSIIVEQNSRPRLDSLQKC